MSRPRAADDFAAIRARMEELRRERETSVAEPDAGPGPGRLQARTETDAERRRRQRMAGLTPPWVPTIFVRKQRR